MPSTFVELGGFACLVEAANLLLGRGAAFAAAGVALLIIAFGIDDIAIAVKLRRAQRSLTVRLRRTSPTPRGDSPHPDLEIDPVSDEVARELAEQVLRRQSGERRMSAVN